MFVFVGTIVVYKYGDGINGNETADRLAKRQLKTTT
jgi:hypothetical protein